MQVHASQEKEGVDKRISWNFIDFLSNKGLVGLKNAGTTIFPLQFSPLFFGECLVVACLFSIFAGSLAPEVNESHYFTKAKYFWDRSFAPRDLFLNSADAHWFFFSTIGYVTKIASLPVAAWCGRVLGWFALSIAWCIFVRRMVSFRLAATISAPLWVASTHWGQLSGEWVVGGCEAKVFAYALALIGLSEILANRWSKAWCWFGMASAFHVLTGGWITLVSLICYSIIRWSVSDRRSSIDRNSGKIGHFSLNATAWFRGSASEPTEMLALPAELQCKQDSELDMREAEPQKQYVPRQEPGNEPFYGGDPREVSKIEADTAILEPMRFQWLGLLVGGCLSLPGLLPALTLNRGVDPALAERGAVIYVFQRLPHHLSPVRFAMERWLSFGGLVAITLFFAWAYSKYRTNHRLNVTGPSVTGSSLRPLLLITTVVSSIAIVGLLIDLGVSPWANNWSASLLRFYWFRWNDVVWPTLLTLLVLRLASESKIESSQSLRFLAILALAVPGPVLFATRYFDHNRAVLPPADQASLVMRSESPFTQKRIREDWLDVCDWIKSNTPTDSLFLTPRFQQTFKWYAHRAEVACWKDAPQDALGLIEWERRMLDIFPRSDEGYGLPLTDQHLLKLQLSYNLDYVVVDRRIQKQPLLLPILHTNENYAVFEFPR